MDTREQSDKSIRMTAITTAEPGTSSRLEVVWAWASLLALVICWDAAVRLDQHVSVPRIRIAHAGERARADEKDLADHAGKYD